MSSKQSGTRPNICQFAKRNDSSTNERTQIIDIQAHPPVGRKGNKTRCATLSALSKR